MMKPDADMSDPAIAVVRYPKRFTTTLANGPATVRKYELL